MPLPALDVLFRTRPRRRGRWAPARRAPRPGLWARLTPPQLFVVSFGALVAMGAAGFKTLPGLYAPGAPELSWLDAAFTATSAVCVTGLIVVDTATYFTVWGQAWILLLIQLGGLGIIAFTSLIVALLGRRLSLRQEGFTSALADVNPSIDVRRLVRHVVLFTFVFEAAGALLLWGAFAPRLGARGALWPAFFHAISAFCNAGFSTFSSSLIGYARDPFVLLVVAGLVIVGGIGFLTLDELVLWAKARRHGRRFRLSLHSKLALVTTAALLTAGTVGAAAFEWTGTLAAGNAAERWLGAFFISVTARTAGFNTIDYGRASDATNFMTILLMFVGGSPGSTAGGVKTTTLALLGLLMWGRFRGQQTAGAWGRSVPAETIERAAGLAMTAMLLVTAAIFALTALENYTSVVVRTEGSGRFLNYMFEAVSAFNTVGLSMNVTPTLSPSGRVVCALLMFVGRVGPLTFAAALYAPRPSPPGFRYAYEDVVVG